MMNGSSEGDEFSNGNIDEMDEKLKSMSLDGDGGHDDEEEEEEDNNDDNNDECNSNTDRGQSSLSHANYYDEPPHQLNSLNHLFHIDFMRSMQNLRSQDRRFKHGTRRSCTFTNEQMRQIERENQILLNKILAQRPRSSMQRSTSASNCMSRASSASRISSAAINRRHQQERIDFANNILAATIRTRVRIARPTSIDYSDAASE